MNDVTVEPKSSAELREGIAKERAKRREAGLEAMRANRIARDRLEEQERRAAKAEAKAEKKRQKAEAERKKKEPKEDPKPIQEEWAERDAVRARYAPRDSVERDNVMAERTGRRAAYRAEQAEKAANPPPPKPPKPVKVPMPSPLREEVVSGRESRRHEWFATHAREPEEVPLPKRRDLKQH